MEYVSLLNHESRDHGSGDAPVALWWSMFGTRETGPAREETACVARLLAQALWWSIFAVMITLQCPGRPRGHRQVLGPYGRAYGYLREYA